MSDARPEGGREAFDPDERTLAERIESGARDLMRPGDAKALGDAASWVDRVDHLVRDADSAPHAGNAPAAEAVRDAVLAGLTPRGAERAAAAGRRSPVPRLPWWRAAAPFVVAAGLAGLFLWQYRDHQPVASPDPTGELTNEQGFASTASEATRRTHDAPGAPVALEKSGVEKEALTLPPAAGSELVHDAPMARTLARTVERAPRPAAEAAAESLLTILRGEPDPSAVEKVRTRWDALRPAVTDTALVGAVERALRDAGGAAGPR